MNDEMEDVVKVLYDYSYTDDKGPVDIKCGDVYRLVEKTNEEWWQVYNPSDENGESFFVPAQYVEIVSEKSPWKTLSDLDKALLEFENSPSDKTPEPVHDGPIHRPQPAGANGEPEGDYINLEAYRNAIGIPNPVIPNPPTPNPMLKPAVSQDLLQGTIPPPLPEEGTYIKVLVEGMPWDIYKEHSAGRLFYVNRETNERMWKPPRKEKSTTPSTSDVLRGSNPQSPNSPLTPSGKEGWSGIPTEYEQVHDNGSIYFIHKSTQEKRYSHPEPKSLTDSFILISKWKTIVDKVGRHYFHKMGTNDTLWDLPSSNSEIDCDAVYSNRLAEQPRGDENWESPGHRLSTFGEPSSRASKARSTYGLLESSNNNRSKASTLPANFTVARPAPVAPSTIIERTGSLTSPTPPSISLTTSSSSGSLQANDEVFGSYLNRAKLNDLGGSKKKSKKNWNQMYVVLQGSNLVFYKDQKAASQKPGSPHGRPEGVISLQGAHVTFQPPKEVTTKKNTILISVLSGSYFLFNSESEKTIREWFIRMKLVANDITPTDAAAKDLEDKKGFSRSISVDESVDKNKNIIGLRAKLRNFISGRPSKEDLLKQGIIRDSVFGSRLNELCDREKTAVPKFVHSCIQAVEARGVKQDGLYRVSGNMAQIQKLRYAVDKDDTYNLYEEQWDIHVLTGSLKLFFRELREPVFPFHMYKKFVDAIQKESKDQLSAFKSAVSNLPRCNYYTLKELFTHLRFVIEFSHENRMQAQNVAIVFGPTLMWQECAMDSLAVQTVYQSRIVEYILLRFPDLFK